MMFERSRWSRRLLPGLVALAALAWASPAMAVHLPGWGHTISHPDGNRTPVDCTLDDWCLWVDNDSAGNNAVAIIGRHTASSGDAPGVYGTSNSTSPLAVGVRANVSGPGYGVRAATGAGGWGVFGETSTSGYGVYGFIGNGTGAGAAGVRGLNTATGATGIGVRGEHNGYGNGVYGAAAAANVGAAGVLGEITGTAGGGVGVHGHHRGGGYGVYGNAVGTGGVGVVGNQGNMTGFAGYFQGRVHINGVLSKAGGSFKIDHPLDPANKYLSHSFVESPDMKNVYDGVAMTNAKGFATVKLPSYFQALNRDFRYQLTIVGKRGWDGRAAIWERIRDNRFTIRTTEPGVTVSWQVTGIRKDRWANANRIQVEQAKPASERGSYLNPELYGASQAKAELRLPPAPKVPPAPEKTAAK